MKKQVHLVISGRVQGVFFRASASFCARKLGLTGFARNLSNGDVELVAEGDEAQLKKMMAWSRQGPPGAQVDHVTAEWSEATGSYAAFSIR